MGLRHRSIRLRVGILIAVPVLCLAMLYAFAASSTLVSALTQTRVQSVKNDLAGPVSAFQQQVAVERGLALVSLAAPADREVAGALGVQEAATSKALARLDAAFKSPAVTANASAAEFAAMHVMARQSASLNFIRSAVANDGVSIQTALRDYDAIIGTGNGLLDEIIDAQANVPIVTDSLDVLRLDQADQTAVAETDMLAADMAQRRFPVADRATIAALAASRQQLAADALPDASRTYRTAFASDLPAAVSGAMLTAESAVNDTTWRTGPPPSAVVSAKTAFGTYALSLSKALTLATAQLQQAIDHRASTVRMQLLLAADLGFVVVIASVMLSLMLGRGLVRQLRELRESALTLAHDKLPGIISQLRDGQRIDPAEYAPAEVPTSNEIEQVQQAFSVVQHAAVQSAVDEARLRRGISDVFRNLAGRSQSLLHRQLTLLDSMERRATEPEQLEDLFRIDHLTTRMRRHAEGLIILSGDTPARGWRQPVPLVDVLRAAVAEVEDYTRIRVTCRTSAAVAGHAVADLIHLLAELAENATVFSPPNTMVRMQGDIVGQGFAIEIEDGGLGISRARLDEINANLANPPQFDLSGSDRLGLFIAGRLAQRHDIKVTLRPSAYGGTTAIVLIPAALVVEENAADRGPQLPAGQDDRAGSEPIGGRHASQTPIRAGNRRGPRSGNGHVAPAGDPGRGVRGSGFTPGRPTPADVGHEDTRPEPARAEPARAQQLRLAAPPGDGGNDARAPATAEPTELGLPVRVRQASLAPQLRNPPSGPLAETGEVSGGFSLPRRTTPAASTYTPAPADPDPAGPPASPEAARAMVSALQRGWQLGRAEAAESPEPHAAGERDDAADETAYRDDED